MNLRGKSEEEAKALFSDACEGIARSSAESGKVLVIERWDLR
ncbi:hypothetical protein [Candidatus Methylacidithermus pantelleriae]|uniref:Uncharacterized protein n=1 Tax=Candidatus Methylacidithermus pantelleriae TaxID=2744239 RepID=A0A8J2FN78_9BACT|nr:hypothetical protein [Candidatus Methylacidithermus pantelleriae]CAF0693907.1 hypothetical protein MPNT_150013 [Candidatus Methylacidithermus pantelleriae]